MEKFDEALDAAKLRVMGLSTNNITRIQLAFEDIIHAIELLSDEVVKNQQLVDSAYNKGLNTAISLVEETGGENKEVLICGLENSKIMSKYLT